MTTVVVLATPPIEGECLEGLAGVLAPADAAALYRAMLADVCEAVQRGGADLLVNYPDPETGPGDVDPESALRELLAAELPAGADVRYEVQVGESHAGRVGNAVTHLLEDENEATVAAVEPTAPFLRREHVGHAAMKLRSSQAVLGASTDGRVYFAGFREPIDFQDAYAAPAVETLTDRAAAAGHDVDFLPTLPVLESEQDLSTALPLLNARRSAGRLLPARTAEVVSGLDVPLGTASRHRSDSS